MRTHKFGIGAIAFLVAMTFGLMSTAPVQAKNDVLCRSWKWTCDGKLGYNPHHSYWRQLTGHNCTNYVAFRLIRDGAPKKFGPFGGNAQVWDEYFKRRGFKVNHKPSVGAIAHWNGWEYGSGAGHVAYVDKVGPNYIIIDEDAWGGLNYRRKIYIHDSKWPRRFIHLDKKKS